jgi:hypothetical protein
MIKVQVFILLSRGGVGFLHVTMGMMKWRSLHDHCKVLGIDKPGTPMQPPLHRSTSSTIAPPLDLFVNFVNYCAIKPSRRLCYAISSQSRYI